MVRICSCVPIAKTGSDRYEQLLDVNGDGIINARDYVLLDRQFNAAK